MPDEFFETMLGDFLDESEEHLTSLNDNLLRLDELVSALDDGESCRCDDELMNEMFRSAHSLKGLSAMMGLTNINGLTHKVENVFDAARNDQLRLNSTIVEHVFQAVDRLRLMVDALKDPSAPKVECDDVVAAIKATLAEAGVDREQKSQKDIENAIAGLEEQPSEEPQDLPAQSGAPATTDPSSDPFAGLDDDYSAPANYLEIFIDESSAALDAFTDTLVDINEPASGEVVNDLLVLAHRIKGGAASVGLARGAKLAHCVEDILQQLRDEQQPVTPTLATSFLACADGLRRYIEQLKTGRADADTFGTLIVELQAAFATTKSQSGEATFRPQTAAKDNANQSQPSPAWDTVSATILAAAPHGVTGVVGRARLAPGQPLPGMKGRLIYDKLSQAGELFYTDPPDATVADLDDLTWVDFGVLTERKVEDVRRLIDISGVEDIEIKSIADSPLPSKDASRGAAQVQDAKRTESVASHNESKQKSVPPAESAPAADANRPSETIRVDIERLDDLMNLAGQLVINKARFAQIGGALKHLAGRKQSAHAIGEILTIVRRLDADMRDGGREARLDSDAVRNQLRRMQAGLESVERDIAQLAEARPKVVDLLDAVHQLDRVSDSLQKSVMDTRMVPVGPLFNRFKRVIRDITRANGKEIRLEIHGEKTELDKRMIDGLGDPLVHMVRNSADHGIESPEEREAAGKPRQGTVSLNAYHSGNSIIVQMKDDGRGLPADKLLAKAIERGVVSAADADKLTPQQIYQLIWEPGFSTAKQVTDISGRGMGMDIVRSAIEDINGQVELDSVAGEGTTFTIKLPLTLAILPSLLARIDNEVVALPIESVVEIVSVPRRDFTSVHGKQTAIVRGRVVSVADLFSIFDWHGMPRRQRNEAAAATLVIICSEGRELALLVDELLGEQDVVIKSVSENYRNVAGIAGASILGDGRVSLILDVATVIDMAASSAKDVAPSKQEKQEKEVAAHASAT